MINHATPDAPSWVVDPAVPGDNLPPAGQSLFDHLFAADNRNESRPGIAPGFDIPFPFTALLARLDEELARDPNSRLPPAKRVLIPLGRSLQRTAAAPDYFEYPRVVVAADAEPASTSTLFLKDRLYIGYQEKSDVLEVISYNEAAGRFEFQLVRDYRAGANPRVTYANRTLCFACHQNGAPIFSRALWDETNATPKIAGQLAATGGDFYGIPLARGVDVPYAIDIGIRRANDFALTQRLWRDACGNDEPAAKRCRSSVFTAALRHALADGRKGYRDKTFDEAVAPRLLAQTIRLWPKGLAVGSSELPNRNPLQGVDQWPDDAHQRATVANVAAAFEPLVPRPPSRVWRADTAGAIDQLIGGLAEFIAASDRQRLAAALAGQQTDTIIGWRAPCRFHRRASRWSAHCQAPSNQTGGSGGALQASLRIEDDALAGGRIERLTLPTIGGFNGIALTPALRALADASLALTDQELTLIPADTYAPRGADGNPLVRIAFRVAADDQNKGEVLVEFRQEFPIVAQAVSKLAASVQGDALFGARPFPRTAIMNALLAELGAERTTACCQSEVHLPPPRSDAPTLPSSHAMTSSRSLAKDFLPYCATCHQGDERVSPGLSPSFPPNFLSGSDDQVAARLRQCAPRLFVRLSMPDIAPDQREKTPMPPESLLPTFGTDTTGWRASPVRVALLAKVGEWLRVETGQAPDLRQLLAGGYEALRPCLPDRP